MTRRRVIQGASFERPPMEKKPAASYAVIAIVLILLLSAFLPALTNMNPDSRSTEQMFRDYITYRNKYIKPEVKLTDEYVKIKTTQMTNIMRKMGINGKASVVYDKTKKGKTIEEIKNGGSKYVYRGNIFGYVREFRLLSSTQTINSLRSHDSTKESTAWLVMPTEEFLSAPLAPVYKVDGSKMLDYDGRVCLLVEPLAEQVTKANAAMHAKTKQEFKPIVCYRSNLHQAAAFVGKWGEDLDKEAPGLMRPGNSHHGMGLAMDLANQQQATKYLREIGVACGFIGGDKGHCSFGESDLVRSVFGFTLPSIFQP